jgi:nicotinamide-nucleotide amidase
MMDERDIAALARSVGERLRARGLTIATAESCTGGAVAAALARIPGASDYLRGGIVAYHAEVKQRLLGVPAALIARDGVVSAACALAMARGARDACGADIGVATTGIAGPGGAEPGKPVGLVHLAIAWPDGEHARHTVYPGDRAAVISAAVFDALELVMSSQSADGSRQ